MNFRKCSICIKLLPLNQFSKDKSRPLGYGYRCKECYKKYYQLNKRTWRIYGKTNKEKNPQKFKYYHNEYNKNNRVKYLSKLKARNYANSHNQRGNRCLECGTIEDLNFHHTNYERNEGITLCKECHYKTHYGDVSCK